MSVPESLDDFTFQLTRKRDLHAILVDLREFADLTDRRICAAHGTELAGPGSHESALLIVPDSSRPRAAHSLDDFCGVIHRYEKDKNICSHSSSLRQH